MLFLFEAATAMRYPEAVIEKAMDGQFKMLSDDGVFNPRALDVLSKSFVELGILEKEPDRKLMYLDRFVPVAP